MVGRGVTGGHTTLHSTVSTEMLAKLVEKQKLP